MKIVKFGIGILVVVLVVIGAVSLIKKRNAADEKEKTAIVYPIKVKSFTPKEEKQTLTLPYLAEVKNDKDVMINSKFAGRILFVIKLGEKVKKGEIIARIDDSDLKSKLKDITSKISSLKDKIQAETLTLKNLLATHKRTKALLDVKMASIEEYQSEESKIASLKAQIKSDENSLRALDESKKSVLNSLTYTEIKAPINGIVSAKFANKDDNIFPGKPILKISSENGNYLFITLPKKQKEIIYKGKIYKLTSLNLAVNGLLAFKVKVDDDSLVNGEKVNVNIVEFSSKGIKLPYDAILSINGKNYIFNTKGDIKEVKIFATGKDGVIVNEAFAKVIVAKPDILLRIKAGYPVKVEK